MKTVAVLRGGPSAEYSVSMETGKAVNDALRRLGYSHKDVVITRKGEWLVNGFVKRPEQVLEAIDVVFVALHGEYGEDGQVQKILERLNIPFTGSRALPSAIAFNKELTKNTLNTYDVKLPRHRVITRIELETLDEDAEFIFDEVGSELFVKPIFGGSSIDAKFAPTEEVLKATLRQLLDKHERVMVEEFIRGKEATVGVLSNYRNEDNYILPVVEIVPPRHDVFYSKENKYDGSTQLICPGRFPYSDKSKLNDAAMLVHEAIGCSQYSRSDFILKDDDVYFLEINTLPGLTPHSNFPKASQAVGLSFNNLVKHLVDTATV